MSAQDYCEIDWVLGERFQGNVITDDKLYGTIRKLTRIAYPTMKKGDTRWFYLYVPVKRDRKITTIGA
jgi:hypothetical protein